MRQAIGSAGKIRVDANQGYRTWREAVRVITAMEKYDLVYAEQPVEGPARHGGGQRAHQRAGHGRRERLDRRGRARDRAPERRADAFGLLHQAGRPRARQAPARGRGRGRAAVRHQRLGGDGDRRRGRSASRGVLAGDRASGHDPGDLDGRDGGDQGGGPQISRRPDQDAVPLRARDASTCRTGLASASRSTRRRSRSTASADGRCVRSRPSPSSAQATAAARRRRI